MNSNSGNGGFSTFAVPNVGDCKFSYCQNFSTHGYTAASSTVLAPSFALAKNRIHPALNLPLGVIAGFSDAYFSPNNLYGVVEHFNYYYPNENFKKTMKLTKYYYNSSLTIQSSTCVG
ncbi:hypothetical protein ACFOU0_04470 [Salinicoccus sesuvii]|uniref:Uncharacterized protein n=1 Tax=Salinicoccus sesuvii TaxID=868281 RepID=A0ABV7N5U4_9STAP